VALGILKKLGFNADIASNGEEALKAIETKPYDVVFMDVQMPVMDGLEVTRRIRKYENELKMMNNPKTISPHVTHLSSGLKQSSPKTHRTSLPIIAMTAYAMAGDREKCIEAGMDDYISKPITPKILAGVLEKWLTKDAG
jgi:CheY-like chemotaxis protein